jgi:oligoribonuclease NrnB/cAMP/cGMP phosphodiesterase (DHH superfamily)
MLQKKAVIFSHDDLDGVSPVSIAKEVFGEQLVYSKTCGYDKINEEIISFLESDKYSLDQIIFITDIGITSDTAKRLQVLYQKGQSIVLLDHHITNIDLNKYEWAFVQPTVDGKKESGTSLFYKFLLDNEIVEPNIFLSSYVEMVRKYDTWDWFAENDMLAHDLNMLFFLISKKEMQKFISEGVQSGKAFDSIPTSFESLIACEKNRIDRYCHSKLKTIRWVTLSNRKTAIIYLDQYQPYVADAVQDKYPDTDVICMIDVAKERVSLRARKDGVIVNDIAQMFGGGGHIQAAGFQLPLVNFNDFVFHSDKKTIISIQND